MRKSIESKDLCKDEVVRDEARDATETSRV